GKGYQVMRISRRRFYGHPRLIQGIEAIGKEVDKKQLGTLLIGDLAQPRGGPFVGGHASHQNGLDADIWFMQPEKGQLFDLNDRETLSARSIEKTWTDRERFVLKIVSERPEIERIFVAAWIKKDLCQHFPGQSWLNKIRPWWGHDDHFHIRMGCPPGDRDCR